MTTFSDDELIDYVLGRPIPRAEEITRQIAVDEELAAQIDIMRAVSGRPAPTEPAVAPLRRRFAFPAGALRRSAAAVVAIFMLGGVCWAAWYVFHEKPLLHDNFNDRWLNPLLWFTPRPIVREENGHLTLVNRGYLVTDAEFRDPISLSLRWRWRDFGWPAYSDNLSIVLRTSGQPKPRHNFLITDGIAITFDAGDGSIGIYLMPDGTKLARTDAGTLPMPAGEWHDIRITDDGETIAVYLRGPEIPKKRDEKAILTARRPERSPAYHIAVYNRELVAQVPHESHIDDFVVERLR